MVLLVLGGLWEVIRLQRQSSSKWIEHCLEETPFLFCHLKFSETKKPESHETPYIQTLVLNSPDVKTKANKVVVYKLPVHGILS